MSNTSLENYVFGKTAPQAPQLEEVVLGACMLDKSAFRIVYRILKEKECFYVRKHQWIYEAMANLYGKSQPIDLLTVMEELNRMNKLNQAGGPAFLSELTNRVASAANIEHHSRIVLQKYIGRKIIEVCSLAIKQAYEEQEDPLELLDAVHQTIYSIQNSMSTRSIRAMRDIIPDMTKRFVELRLREDGLVGVPSGLKSIDRITGGWQNTDLIIICARPGMGKTAFAMTMIRHMIIDMKLKVGVFSLEMSDTQLIDRLISGITQISSRKFRDPKKLTEAEADQYLNTANDLVNYNLFIDDTPGIRISECRGKARTLKEEEGIDIIVIDYLQLMRGQKGQKNREQAIGEISRGLKGLAKELNVPVIALAQLSRETEKRGGARRPQLSDLRESGSIEQDADVVAGLYRPEYYGITEDKNGQPLNGLSELIFLKHRNGPTVTILMKFVPVLTRFFDVNDQPALADEQYTPYEEITDKEDDNHPDEDLPF